MSFLANYKEFLARTDSEHSLVNALADYEVEISNDVDLSGTRKKPLASLIRKNNISITLTQGATTRAKVDSITTFSTSVFLLVFCTLQERENIRTILDQYGEKHSDGNVWIPIGKQLVNFVYSTCTTDGIVITGPGGNNCCTLTLSATVNYTNKLDYQNGKIPTIEIDSLPLLDVTNLTAQNSHTTEAVIQSGKRYALVGVTNETQTYQAEVMLNLLDPLHKKLYCMAMGFDTPSYVRTISVPVSISDGEFSVLFAPHIAVSAPFSRGAFTFITVSFGR